MAIEKLEATLENSNAVKFEFSTQALNNEEAELVILKNTVSSTEALGDGELNQTTYNITRFISHAYVNVPTLQDLLDNSFSEMHLKQVMEDFVKNTTASTIATWQ
jgi:hypothetical protein